MLAIFDLVRGAEIARWIPESGPAQSYLFSDDGVTGCLPSGPTGQFELIA